MNEAALALASTVFAMPLESFDHHCHVACPNGPRIHPILRTCSTQHMRLQLRLAMMAPTLEECAQLPTVQNYAAMLHVRMSATPTPLQQPCIDQSR